MYKKILVPLDGSQFGECVLEHVKAVAAGCNVPEVLLLFVAEPAPSSLYESSAEVKERLMAWGREYLTKIEQNLSAGGLNVQSILLEGRPAETISDYARKNNIDLIIMSTHGRSGPSRWAFGSVTEKVIRSSQVTMLIVTPKECRIVL